MYSEKHYEILRIFEGIGRSIVKYTYIYLHAHKELQEDPKYRRAYLCAREIEAYYSALRNNKAMCDEYLRNEDFITELWIKNYREEVEEYRENAEYFVNNFEKINRHG